MVRTVRVPEGIDLSSYIPSPTADDWLLNLNSSTSISQSTPAKPKARKRRTKAKGKAAKQAALIAANKVCPCGRGLATIAERLQGWCECCYLPEAGTAPPPKPAAPAKPHVPKAVQVGTHLESM